MAAKKRKKAKKAVKAKKVLAKSRTAAKKSAKPSRTKKVAKKNIKTAKAPAKKALKSSRKTSPRKIKGEGDYAASRRFLKDQSGFVEKNKAAVPAMGKEAEAALDGPQGAALRDAEATAAARSRDIF
jgi:hypothetical protein